MEFIESNSIDAYLSGLMYHLVPVPEDLIKEASRILKPKGKFSFSVFGDMNKSQYFTLFDQLMKREGVMSFRSKFHMNDEPKIIKMLEKNGFGSIKFFRQDLPFTDEFVSKTNEHFEMPANKAMLKNLDDYTVDKLKTEMKDRMDGFLKKEHVGVESLIVTAVKL